MVGNFQCMKVELWNQMTNEQKHFRVTSYQELDQMYDEFHKLLSEDDFWKMLKSPYLKCVCGKMVECSSFTNTCHCGRDYNSSGTELAPRDQWGCETGEHWTDCY